MEQRTDKPGIRLSTAKECSLVHAAELFRLFGTAPPPLLKSAARALQVRGKSRKTDWTERKRIAHLLNLKDIVIVQAGRIWYWLRCRL